MRTLVYGCLSLLALALAVLVVKRREESLAHPLEAEHALRAKGGNEVSEPSSQATSHVANPDPAASAFPAGSPPLTSSPPPSPSPSLPPSPSTPPSPPTPSKKGSESPKAKKRRAQEEAARTVTVQEQNKLWELVASADFEALETLLKDSPHLVNHVDEFGSTALHVSLGASFHVANTMVSKPTFGFARNAHTDITRLLLGTPAVDPTLGALCPLYSAVAYRDLPSVRMLLEPSLPGRAMCVSQREQLFDQTPLHYAALSKAAGIARVVMALFVAPHNRDYIESELDVDVSLTHIMEADSDDSFESMLTFAALTKIIGHQDILALVDGGADLTALDKRSNCALHLAAEGGRFSLVKWFLGHKSVVKECLLKRNSVGMSPYDLAVTGGFHEVAVLLNKSHTVPAATTVPPRAPVQREDPSPVRPPTGWERATSVLAPFDGCNIEVVDGRTLTSKSFLEAVQKGTPLLITHVEAFSKNFEYERGTVLSRSGLLKTDALTPIEVSSVPYGALYGQDSERVTLSDFIKTRWEAVDSMPLYAFDGGFLDVASFKIEEPRVLASSNVVLRQFALGPAGTGSAPHFHGHALNILYSGRKHWVLTPPSRAGFSVRAAVDFFSNQAFQSPSYNSYTCVQEEGDAVFVPHFWGHAVLNTLDSLAIAYEFEA